MKLFPKSHLSTALAAVLTGVAASGNVNAVTLSQDNIGDVGIGPYYTMRAGWATDTLIINTSGSTVAAKVRYHEARNSREVLDFIVVLSPWDVINFWAYDNVEKGPIVEFPAGNSEGTCVVPIPTDRAADAGGKQVGGYIPFSAFEYAGRVNDVPRIDRDGFISDNPDPLNRLKEGYFTVIEMGVSNGGPIDTAAKAKDCATIEAAFATTESVLPVYQEFERNLNNLKVSYSITNAGRGTQGAGSATMLSNFATDYSAIPHTLTSIRANLTADPDLAALQAAADATAAARTAAYTSVVNAMITLDVQKGVTCTAVDDIPTDAFLDNDDMPTGDPAFANRPNPDRVETDVSFPTLAADLEANPAMSCGGGGLAANYNAAVNSYALSNTDAKIAAANLNDYIIANPFLGAPKNLIHAQQGGIDPDPEAYPNLNSGDFFAYWLVDGQYRDSGTFNQLPGGNDVLNLPFGLWAGLYPRPVDAVTALLMKSNAMNEWAFNSNTGASTDLVLTAPTKRFYTDFESLDAPHLGLISPLLESAFRTFPFGIPPFLEQFSRNGEACDPVAISLWNNDEIGPDSPVLPSPTATLDLCWETNVVYSGLDSVLGSEVGQRLPIESLLPAVDGDVAQTYNGWVDVNMATVLNQYHPAIPILNVTLPNVPNLVDFDEIVQIGMPYIGWGIKQRDLGNPVNAYTGITPHSYLRNWDRRNAVGGELTEELVVMLDQMDPEDFLGLLGRSIFDFFRTNPFPPQP